MGWGEVGCGGVMIGTMVVVVAVVACDMWEEGSRVGCYRGGWMG